jgi:hypothetical protein
LLDWVGACSRRPRDLQHPQFHAPAPVAQFGARAAVNEGEIVVASNEELHAARLSGKRLLALWNALPEVFG